jgi:hypothetical protein
MLEDDDVRTGLLTSMPRLSPTGLGVARVILHDPPGTAQLTVDDELGSTAMRRSTTRRRVMAVRSWAVWVRAPLAGVP